MLIVTGIFEVEECCVDDIQKVAAKMAVASRAEAECHEYAFYQDIENPLRFRVFERWTDEAALAAHFQEPHMAEFQAALAGLKITSLSVVKFPAGEMTPVA